MSSGTDRILVVVEREEGRVAPLTFELLHAGRKLGASNGAVLCACILGSGIGDLSGEIVRCADEVHVIDHPALADFQADIYASALESVCRAVEPITLLMGHTYDNLELAPKLARRIKGELITDCGALEADGDHLLCTKAVYGGNAVVVFEMENTPRVITIRPKVYDAAAPAEAEGRVVGVSCELSSSLALTESISIVPEEKVSLDTAEVIVAGGRGVKKEEDIRELEQLMNAFKKHFDRVELGASRPLVEAGYFPRSRQIGQTGERVSPQLYVAVAISGASQHGT